jgi:drug/metabolite transporter (DMT)-like permease
MAVALGILVAMSFGSADFLGGRASRTAPTVTVLFLVQATAVLLAIVVAVLVSADITGRDLAFGAVAGALNVVGLGFLYQGLATGRMGVVAPVTAVVAAMVPIAWGLASGERPSALTWIGVALAVGAGGLVAREPSDPNVEAGVGVRNAVVLAVVAGLALGSSFVLYAETHDDSGMWPVFTARLAAIALVGIAVVVMATRGPVTWPSGSGRNLALGAGVLDVAATTLLLVAVREGLTVVVAPVAALAPAFTVVWAWIVLHERVTRHQIAGLLIALTGLVLIAAG